MSDVCEEIQRVSEQVETVATDADLRLLFCETAKDDIARITFVRCFRLLLFDSDSRKHDTGIQMAY